MSSKKGSFWLSAQGLAALGLIGAASYFLLIEHREHLFAFLPYLILLLCPLMHIFMHGGHGHGHSGHGEHGGHDDHESDQDAYERGLEEGRKQAERRNHH